MADADLRKEGYHLPSEFLSDDFFTESDEENPKCSVMGTSPQSTLCGIGSLSFSSNGSPNGPSQGPSPPSTPFTHPRDDALELLYAAVGQVERLKLNDEILHKDRNVGRFYPNQELIKQQLQAARFYQLRRQQLMKMHQQQQQYAAANAVWERERQRQARSNAVSSLRLSASEWPPLQKQQSQPGSGMTAVFLNGGRRQSNGTGVFLPRRVGTPVEPRKKSACSTVLLPARVVQALNLNVEEMGVVPRVPGCYVLENDDGLRSRSNLKWNQHQRPSADICLPQEWTY